MKRRTTDQVISRRTFASGAAALGVTALLPSSPALAQATAHRFQVGAAEITVLTDGTMAVPLDWVLPGRKREEVSSVFEETGQKLADLTLQVNVALIRLGNELILIDAGGGADFAPARGKLHDNLEKAGIKPDAVTQVVFTHAHPDHFWGLFDPLDGGTLFPKARHFMTATERDYWLQPGVETSVPEAVRGAAIGTQRRLKEIGDRIETFKPGAEIVPGLTAIDTAGHSPGHSAILLQSGNGKLLIGGDVLIEPVLSFARPTWPWGPDWDQTMAIAARQRTLDLLATDKIPLLGYHLPWPGLGRVERHAGAYRLTPPV